MTIWVTGAQGMLGRCVGRQLIALGVPWVGTDVELDIADRRIVEGFMTETQPSALINCAAYTAVDAAESHESEAHRVNAVGPAVLAAACRLRDVRFAHVSTDYVFDGTGTSHLSEDSPVGPCNVYGRTKLEGEREVAQAFRSGELEPTARWYIVRTSWLFGAGRSSFVDTMCQLMLERVELRVVDDQHGRPTYAADLASMLVRAIGAGADHALPSGVWHYANSGVTTWFGLACRIRDLMLESGIGIATERLVPVTSEEFPRPAPRPRNAVLSTYRLETQAGLVPRTWQDALRDYIEHRQHNEVGLGKSEIG